MNNGIKNKLKELIGKEVDILGDITISYPSTSPTFSYTISRFEDEDCVVLSNNRGESYLSIDHIKFLVIGKI
jgi:hypothetical protein